MCKALGDSALIFPLHVLSRVKEVLQCLFRLGIFGFHRTESRFDS
jgi:hypothetical protein